MTPEMTAELFEKVGSIRATQDGHGKLLEEIRDTSRDHGRRLRSLEQSRARALGIITFFTTGPVVIWEAAKAALGK